MAKLGVQGFAPRVGILGAGPGGMCMGIRLLQQGITSFIIFEKSDGVGGTWRDNGYPGAACDVRSHLYSYSFEPKRDWSRVYAAQPEILAYLEHCADKYGLRPYLRLGTTVTEARWVEERAVWRLRTEDGEEVEVDMVVSGLGMLNVPSYPVIPGLDRFEGTVFHSARWRHDHDLSGRRVASIGTGASAVQFLPAIAPEVEQLHVFQRTAGWVAPKADRPYTDEELRRFGRRPMAARSHRLKIWYELDRFLSVKNGGPRQAQRQALATRHLQESIADPELRARLMPGFPFGGKRPLMSNEYYPTFLRPNVELITGAIDRVTPTGVVTADGVEREVDTIILATGFRASEYLCRLEVIGRDGRRLHDQWAEGASAYLGITAAGFPNFFMLYGPNTNQGSIIFMIERQVNYILRVMRRMKSQNLAWVDVRRRAMERYAERVQRDLDGTVWDTTSHSYYRDPTSGRITTQWPHRTAHYWALTLLPDARKFEAGRASGPQAQRRSQMRSKRGRPSLTH